MVPKSGDTEAKDVSSCDPQVTKPMEASTGIPTSLLGKRKVEVSNVENLGEDEGDKDEEVEDQDEDVEGEEEEEEEDSDLEWDKDSFDGVEFDGTTPYGDDEEHKQMIIRYHRTVTETKGFFEAYEGFPGVVWSGITPVWKLDKVMVQYGMTVREFISNMTRKCVDKYNKLKEKTLKFEHILRANFNPGGKTRYYVTFDARENDSPDEPLVEYQAKVIWFAGDSYPIFCRPSPPKKD